MACRLLIANNVLRTSLGYYCSTSPGIRSTSLGHNQTRFCGICDRIIAQDFAHKPQGILNHEEMTSTFAKALCRIADCLPRQELYLVLYPTKQMKQEVARLYAYLIQFLIKALKWYQEGIFKHIIHSFTQPVGIKYKDILESIEDCSRRIDQWAASSAQAELRDVHILQHKMYSNLENAGSVVRRSAVSVDEIMRRIIDIAPQLTTLISGQVNTCQRIFDLQLSQMLTIAANSSLQDPEISYRYGILRRNHIMQRASRSLPFLDSPKLKRWATSEESSLIVVKGPYSMRDQIRIIGINLIEAVQNAYIPIFWVLPNTIQSGAEAITSIDVLKSLVQQAIRINKNFQNESTCALSCSRMQSAVRESDWFDILGSTFEGLSQIYIVFDTIILGRDGLTLSDNFSWFLAFHSFLERLKARGSRSVIRLIFLSYCETKHMDLNGVYQPEDFTVKIDPRSHTAARQRKRRKIQYRLKGFA